MVQYFHEIDPCCVAGKVELHRLAFSRPAPEQLAVGIEELHFCERCITDVDNPISWVRKDANAVTLVRNYTVVQKFHIKARLVAVVLDIGDFKAGFRCAVGEIGMRVGGGAEGGAVVVAKGSIVDISIRDIVGTVRPENPIGVRYSGVIKISIAGMI